MEFTTIIWRSGVDRFGDAMREDCAKNLCSGTKSKLPIPLTLDFCGPESAIGLVTELYWVEEDKSITARVTITPEAERKWLGFNFQDSIRAAWKVNSSHKSEYTGYTIISNVTLLEISACASVPPPAFPDPYRLI